MPVQLILDSEIHEADVMLRAMINRLENPTPALNIMGETGLASIQMNFEVGGRPAWTPLAESTMKQKGGKGQILIGSGVSGGLLGGINYETGDNTIEWFTGGQVYAAIHNFGGEAGRDLKTEIPQREYMVLQDEDIDEMGSLLAAFVASGRLH